MSLEAWGDEGNVPQNWEDTAAKQEFQTILNKLEKWKKDFQSEVEGEILDKINKCIYDLSEVDEIMTGDF